MQGQQPNNGPPKDGQDSSSHHESGSGDTTSPVVSSAFKLAQTRYRRRGNAPDRIDDLDELVDFSRCSSCMTTGCSPLSTSAIGADLGSGTLDHAQHETCHGRGSDFHANYQNLIEKVNVSDGITGIQGDNDDMPLQYYKGPMYTLQGMPGFYYAPQALSIPLQRALALAAVSRYCEPPHVTNMDSYCNSATQASAVVDTENGIVVHEDQSEPSLSLWQSWKIDAREVQKADPKGKKTTKHTPAAARRRKRSFQKLSWSTMGYHYDWNDRSYHENVKSDMPFEVQQLTLLFATTCLLLEKSKLVPQQQPNEQPANAGTADVPSSPCLLSYTASACIVNYYNPKSLMGGHCDDLEQALDKPLVSMSLGRPAVFLLGGPDKDDGPVIPIWIRPGDVMILGGQSRLRYHGMARLLPFSCTKIHTNSTRSGAGTCHESETTYQVAIPDIMPLDTTEESKPEATAVAIVNSFQSLLNDEEEMALVDQFLTENRINLSVRQVYH